jgi:hypothetical protein
MVARAFRVACLKHGLSVVGAFHVSSLLRCNTVRSTSRGTAGVAQQTAEAAIAALSPVREGLTRPSEACQRP